MEAAAAVFKEHERRVAALRTGARLAVGEQAMCSPEGNGVWRRGVVTNVRVRSDGSTAYALELDDGTLHDKVSGASVTYPLACELGDRVAGFSALLARWEPATLIGTDGDGRLRVRWEEAPYGAPTDWLEPPNVRQAYALLDPVEIDYSRAMPHSAESPARAVRRAARGSRRTAGGSSSAVERTTRRSRLTTGASTGASTAVSSDFAGAGSESALEFDTSPPPPPPAAARTAPPPDWRPAHVAGWYQSGWPTAWEAPYDAYDVDVGNGAIVRDVQPRFLRRARRPWTQQVAQCAHALGFRCLW